MASSSFTDSSVLNINTVSATMYYYNMTTQIIRRLSSIDVAGDLYGYNYKSKKNYLLPWLVALLPGTILSIIILYFNSSIYII